MITLRRPQFNTESPQAVADFYLNHAGINWHCLDPNYCRLKFVEHYAFGDVLDLGCGEGAFSYALAKKGHRVQAVDVSASAISAFVRRLEAMPYEAVKLINIQRCRIEDLDYLAIFDTVVAMEIIEHVPSPELFLAKAYDLMHYGGQILLTTPHVPDWDGEVDHLWRWDYESFNQLLRSYFHGVVVDQDEIFLYGRGLK